MIDILSAEKKLLRVRGLRFDVIRFLDNFTFAFAQRLSLYPRSHDEKREKRQSDWMRVITFIQYSSLIGQPADKKEYFFRMIN